MVYILLWTNVNFYILRLDKTINKDLEKIKKGFKIKVIPVKGFSSSRNTPGNIVLFHFSFLQIFEDSYN